MPTTLLLESLPLEGMYGSRSLPWASQPDPNSRAGLGCGCRCICSGDANPSFHLPCLSAACCDADRTTAPHLLCRSPADLRVPAVLHCVLSRLTASELVLVRSTSVRLRDLATSNIHWRKCLLSDLVPSYAALADIAAIPPRAWSFSLAHDGWFRAYRELRRVTHEPWLRREEDLVGGPWMVYFKHHFEDRDLAGVEDPHALIEFTAEKLAVWVSGVPLHNRRWWLQDEEGVVQMRGWCSDDQPPHWEQPLITGQLPHTLPTSPDASRSRCVGASNIPRS